MRSRFLLNDRLFSKSCGYRTLFDGVFRLTQAILLNQHGAVILARTAMKTLAGLIRRQLRLEANKFGYCGLYDKELQRIWPLDEKNRKAKIEQFAKRHGFRLAYYNHGFYF